MQYYQRELTKASVLQDFTLVSVDNTISPAFLALIKSLCNIVGTAEDIIITSNLQTLLTIFEDTTSYVIFPSVYKAFPNSYAVCCELRNRIRNFILYHRNIISLTSITYLPKDWDGIAPQTTLPITNYYYFDESVYNGMVQIKDSITYPDILINHSKPITVNYNAGFTDLTTMPIDIINMLARGIQALRVNIGDGCADCNSVFTDPINKAVIMKYLNNARQYNRQAFHCNNNDRNASFCG